jgi:transposase
MKKISKKTISKIIALKQKKISHSEVSKRLELSISTVKKYCKENEVEARKSKEGRRRKLSSETKKDLIGKYKRNNLQFLSDGKADLAKKFGVTVCRQTVKNYLKKDGLKCFKKRSKPELSEINVSKRLKFAEQFSEFSYFQWKDVLWTDESKYCLIKGKEIYWNRRPVPLKEENIKRTKKFNGESIIVWGCITGEGTGELVRLKSKVDSNAYIKILEDGLLRTIENKNLDPNKVIFMQDNAPIHTSRITKEWLNLHKINVMDWPPQSPDINPIENLWEIIDKKIRKRSIQPSNLEELWLAIKEEWDNIDKELIRKLYLSMPKRVKVLKECGGKYTKW